MINILQKKNLPRTLELALPYDNLLISFDKRYFLAGLQFLHHVLAISYKLKEYFVNSCHTA